MSSIKLMLVDDHDIVRAGLRMLLDAQPDMEIVAEAGSGPDAITLAKTHNPDIILMDVNMPGMNGIEATRRLTACCPEIAVLALTIHEEQEYFFVQVVRIKATPLNFQQIPELLFHRLAV